ncbi:hypothetical protein EYF80_001162 [Liparis tanakae]|uniref:Uncharacterized protein n=1 Tax=Liparis tanakae TaxID=230148 RepID=A0A4Z2JDX8_9TELE|nr:hypothetical protein EYF80_001162 [Liparis tanakae]
MDEVKEDDLQIATGDKDNWKNRLFGLSVGLMRENVRQYVSSCGYRAMWRGGRDPSEAELVHTLRAGGRSGTAWEKPNPPCDVIGVVFQCGKSVVQLQGYLQVKGTWIEPHSSGPVPSVLTPGSINTAVCPP